MLELPLSSFLVLGLRGRVWVIGHRWIPNSWLSLGAADDHVLGKEREGKPLSCSDGDEELVFPHILDFWVGWVELASRPPLECS